MKNKQYAICYSDSLDSEDCNNITPTFKTREKALNYFYDLHYGSCSYYCKRVR